MIVVWSTTSTRGRLYHNGPRNQSILVWIKPVLIQRVGQVVCIKTVLQKLMCLRIFLTVSAIADTLFFKRTSLFCAKPDCWPSPGWKETGEKASRGGCWAAISLGVQSEICCRSGQHEDVKPNNSQEKKPPEVLLGPFCVAPEVLGHAMH